jgi:TonB-linked SusC/RagA family outer membrane protein
MGLLIAPSPALAGGFGPRGSAMTAPRSEVGTLTGRVTNASGGTPIVGASVSVGATRLGATTDESGQYRVANIPAGTHAVTVRRIGHVPKTLNVTITDGGTATLDFALEASATTLDQVVITGAGTSTVRERLAVSVGSVDSSMLRRATLPNNLVSAMTAVSPGVVIRTQSGEPGASAAIQIRGLSSLSGQAQPLFVVDGTPIDNTVLLGPNNNGGIAGVVTPNRAVDINPSDVESIEILKGPSAAAIYGARAVNGVILVTTKRARGNATRVSVGSTYSNEEITGHVATQRLYGQGMNGQTPQQLLPGCGTTAANQCTRNVWGPLLPAGTVTYDQVDQVTRPGNTWDNNVMFSGGTDRAQFLASIGRTHQNGYFVGPHNWYDRTTARVKGTLIVNPKFTVNGNVSVIDARSDGVQRGDNQFSTVLGGALRTPPEFDLNILKGPSGVYRSVERPNPAAGSETQGNGLGTSPMFLAFEQPNTSELSRVMGNTSVTWTPLPWLKFDELIGVDTYDDNRLSGWPYGVVFMATGAVNRQNFNHLELDHSLVGVATYDVRPWWSNTLTLGHNLNSRRNRTLTANGTNLIAPQPFSLSNTSSFTSSESRNLAHIQSFYAQNEASFYDQVYLTLGVRRDEYSTFGPNNPNALFPRASVAWNVTNFLGNRDQQGMLSYLKLRLGYGETGREPPLYASVNAYSANPGFGSSSGDGPDGITATGGLASGGTLGNANLKPERQVETEFGTDFGFLNQKIDGSLTYYNKKSKDIILSVSQNVAQTGFTSAFLNAGSLENKGVEVQLNTHPWTTENAQLDVGFQLARNRGKTLSLAAGLTEVAVGGGTGGCTGVARIGFQPGACRGTDFVRCGRGLVVTGIGDIDALCAATPGGYKPDALFLAANGLPVADPTPRMIGDPNPNYTWAVNGSLRLWKRLSVSTLFDARVGGDMANGTHATSNASGISKDTEARSRTDGTFGVNYYTNIYPDVAGPGKGVVALSTPIQWQTWFRGDGSDAGPGFQWLEDGSFVKWREISVSYNWTHPTFRRISGFESADIRVGGRNLKTWTDYTGYDPESSQSGAANITQGGDRFTTPQTRSLFISLTLNR